MAETTLPAGACPARAEWRATLAAWFGPPKAAATTDAAFEDQFGRLNALIATPAPDLAAFATKLEIVHAQIFALEPGLRDVGEALVIDARRLLP